MVSARRRRRKGVHQIRTMRGVKTGRGRPAVAVCPRPWVFLASRDRRGVRILVRVCAMQAPSTSVLTGAEGLVVLYRLPGLEEATIHVELKGDVLVFQARGLDPKTRRPFGVHDEVLLPHVLPGSETAHVYSRDILEVRIAPASAPASPKRRGSTHGPSKKGGREHE